MLTNTRLNIRNDRIKLSVQLYHNASISRVLRWILKHASVAYRGGVGVFKPPPEIPKTLQNRAKLNPIVKT